ncbi:TPA: pyocin R2, holin [Pseudomonas aeruginosa]|nr:pyocin R2, holin [Pseudomonas aeruginosa]
MATENDVQQTLSDIPTWLFVLVSMAGLSGELWRAEAAGLTVSDLLKRVLLRSGASVVFGLASVLLATASGAALPVAAALGSVVACLGADVASGFYTRWLARKAGGHDGTGSS